jgi:hypothetical protein
MAADLIVTARESDFLPLETTLNYPKSRPGRLDMT